MSPKDPGVYLRELSELLTRDPRETTPACDGKVQGTWTEFSEFLDASEWELAWDALLAIGKRQSAPTAFYDGMKDLAQQMGLSRVNFLPGTDFFFNGMDVGHLEAAEPPAQDGTYTYMPFRGPGHHELSEELRRTGVAACYYVTDAERVDFQVAGVSGDKPTLRLSHFVRTARRILLVREVFTLAGRGTVIVIDRRDVPFNKGDRLQCKTAGGNGPTLKIENIEMLCRPADDSVIALQVSGADATQIEVGSRVEVLL